jgi:hypothetical protein
MDRPYRHIDVERREDVFCVHIRHRKLPEYEVLEMADELIHLVQNQGCKKLALSLGPETLECLFSLFFARMVSLRRKLSDHGGRVVFFEATPETMSVFEAAHLKEYFDFAPNEAAAVADLAGSATR